MKIRDLKLFPCTGTLWQRDRSGIIFPARVKIANAAELKKFLKRTAKIQKG